VGIYDRRYMRDVPIYRQLTGRLNSVDERSTPEPRHGTVRGTRPWAWVLLGATATLAAIAGVTPSLRHELTLPKTSWVTPAHTTSAPPNVLVPTAPWHQRPIGGNHQVVYGDEYKISGIAPETGTIHVQIRWNDHAYIHLVTLNLVGFAPDALKLGIRMRRMKPSCLACGS
jgi:hypothetical protein